MPKKSALTTVVFGAAFCLSAFASADEGVSLDWNADPMAGFKSALEDRGARMPEDSGERRTWGRDRLHRPATQDGEAIPGVDLVQVNGRHGQHQHHNQGGAQFYFHYGTPYRNPYYYGNPYYRYYQDPRHYYSSPYRHHYGPHGGFHYDPYRGWHWGPHYGPHGAGGHGHPYYRR